MSTSNSKSRLASVGRQLAVAAAILSVTAASQASAPGIMDGTSFALVASAGYTVQPDGMQIYTWGYGCASPTGHTYAPDPFNHGIGFCPSMQLPGPTLIVTESATPVTITLTNNLPAGAGNTSMVFSGFTPGASSTVAGSVVASGGVPGLLAQEATPVGTTTNTVTYTLNTLGKAGTHAYYSGTQSDLQVEMGLYGALVVLPNTVPAGCVALGAMGGGGEEYRLAPSAYDHPATCYDREYLFQWGEIDPQIHAQAEAQVKAIAACPSGNNTITGVPCPPAKLFVNTEPYHPRYYTINGRSMPDDMDPDYAPNYPNQPYNGNPHMHPLDQVLVRTIGQGRWMHPFHEHGNHVRILGRDGNLMLSPSNANVLAGRMEFTTDTYPGQAFDGIFYWSGKGLNWDIYGHTPAGRPACSGASSGFTPSGASNPSALQPYSCNPNCYPDANGYFTAASSPPAVLPVFGTALQQYALQNPSTASLNYGEWCADHNHPLESNPAIAVGAGGMATLPDPMVVTNGLWYNGTPYLGPDAVARSRGPTPLAPGGALQNPPGESGIAFMWHSHNEREITTNDVFPGGMLMMMLVDPPVWYIDETL